jgi:hypothetical protein
LVLINKSYVELLLHILRLAAKLARRFRRQFGLVHSVTPDGSPDDSGRVQAFFVGDAIYPIGVTSSERDKEPRLAGLRAFFDAGHGHFPSCFFETIDNGWRKRTFLSR